MDQIFAGSPLNLGQIFGVRSSRAGWFLVLCAGELTTLPRRRRLRLALLIAACLLGPALLQGETLTCKTGDTRLAELSLTVADEEQLAFDANVQSYDVWLSDSPIVATVGALPMDPAALVYVDVYNDAERFSLMTGVPGGGEVDVPLVTGRSLIKVYVKAPGGASDDYEIDARVCEAECPTPRTWQAAELLEAYDVDNAYAPSVAWDPNGDAIAVWSQHNDAGGEIGRVGTRQR